MEPIELIKQHLEKLKTKAEFNETAEKAEHFGLINRYEMALDRLEICEKYGVTGGSIVKQLPNLGVHFQFKAVCENESSNPENWTEVLFDNLEFTLDADDLLIKR